MKRIQRNVLAAAVTTAMCVSAFTAVDGGRPYALTVEYRTDPVGIDARAPRLSWKLPEGFVRQTAYEIEADGVSCGKVASSDTLNLPWPGGALTTGSRHLWRVRAWDEKGAVSPWSGVSRFVMGVMDEGFWKARWIGPHAVTRPDVDFGGAKWITSTSGTVRVTFELAEVPATKEIVFLSRSPYRLDVNGVPSRGSYEGHIWDGRFAKFHDLACDGLKKGKNTLAFSRKRDGDPFAVICVFREKGETTGLATSGAWAGAEELGGLREVPWATNLVLRDELASPAFEKRFSVAKKVRHATLFITGLGYYEASLNGRRVGDKVLDPSPTDYGKRVLYSTYVLDGEIKTGENTLTVLLGHGFYDVRLKSVWDNDMASWRGVPRLIAQLELEHEDGTRASVVSDGSWRQVKSPIGWDDIREGEVVGGRHVREPAFPAEGFPAAEMEAPGGRLQAENQPPARILYTNRPVRVKPVAGEPGACMVEFPENIAGWARIRFKGLRKGDVVSVRYDEHKDGDLEPAVPTTDYANIRGASGEAVKGPAPRRIDCHFKSAISGNVCAKDRAFQTDRFVARGTGDETYEPRFTWNGFQYLYVRGLRQPLGPDDLEQCVISTDFPEIGAFSSSDPVLDRLVSAAARSYRANFTDGIPTDCPHREKNGWTGDASVASGFAQFRFENTAAYEKWLLDIVDAQNAAGDLPGIVPSPGWGFAWGNGPAWDSALWTVAWNLFLYRDDRRALEIAYPALKRLLDYTATKADADGLVSHGLGDWIPPDWKRVPSVRFTSSCFYMQANETAAGMAAALGRLGETIPYTRRAASLRRAIRAAFMKPDGTFDNGGQTAQSAAIMFGLVEPGEEKAVAAKLVEAVHARNDHLETGVIGCKTLFRALTKVGRSDLALKVVLQKEAPSPGAWMNRGGHTFWEDWGEGASRNHIMFGDIAGWAYECLAGIRLGKTANAFRRFEIAPAWTCGLAWCAASVDSPFGKIAVRWTRDGALDVQVPPGTECTVHLKDGGIRPLLPGRHRVGPASPTPENGITAHRGDSLRHPQNSLEAFAAANDIGADWIETDVHLTRDGILVIAHNATTKAYCSQDLRISEHTYRELCELDMAESFRARKKLTLEQCPKLRIARLDEALDLVLKAKKARLSIQPKCDCVDQAIALVRQKGAVEWVGFNDGNLRLMSRVKELEPSIPVFWDRYKTNATNIVDDIATAKARGFETLVLYWLDATPELVKRLHDAGFKVGVWTVNSPKDLAAFLDMGVDRIYTDDPQTLKEIKRKRAGGLVPDS